MHTLLSLQLVFYGRDRDTNESENPGKAITHSHETNTLHSSAFRTRTFPVASWLYVTFCVITLNLTVIWTLHINIIYCLGVSARFIHVLCVLLSRSYLHLLRDSYSCVNYLYSFRTWRKINLQHCNSISRKRFYWDQLYMW